MAADRYIRWNDNKPTQKEIGLLIEDFFSGLATEFKFEENKSGNWWFVSLPGVPSFPFRQIMDGGEDRGKAVAERGERWIEVYQPKKNDYLNVMTRGQDHITNIIASGLQTTFARYWEGKLEE